MNLLVNELGAAASRAGSAMLAQTAVLVLAMLAVELIVGRRLRATLRCGLWLLVVAKLLLPPSFSLPTGVAYWLGPWLVAPAQVREPDPLDVSVSVSTFEVEEVWPSTTDRRASVRLDAPPLSIPGRLGLAWLAGSAAILGLVIRRNLEVHHWVRASMPATPDQEQVLAEAAGQIGLSLRPQLRVSPANHSPAVCGMLHPVVVLPQTLAERLSRSALRDVLLHELIHIHRRDLWWNLPQTLTVVVWWWNPLVWLANSRVRTLREQAVDEWVMLVRHGDPEAYPATLVEVARLCATRPTFALNFVGILESRRALRTRVERLLSEPVPQRANLGLAGWTVVLLTALLSLPMAFARRAEVSPARPEIVDGGSRRQFHPGPGRVLPNPTDLAAHITRSEELPNNVRKKSRDELRHELNVTRPTPLLPTRLGVLANAEQKKASWSPDIGPDHPARKRVTGVIGRIKSQSNDAIAGILASMQDQLDAGQTALNEINTQSSPADGVASAFSHAKPAPPSDPVRSGEPGKRGLGHQRVMTKLHSTVIPEVRFHGGTLAELVEYLKEQSVAHDPERKGLSFIISDPTESGPAGVDPASGTAKPLSEVTLRPLPALNEIRLIDILDAVVRCAQRPLQYQVEDYAVVFSVPPPPSTQILTRQYRVNASDFLKGVQATTGLTLDLTVWDTKTHDAQVQKVVREFFMACGVKFPSFGTSEGTSPFTDQPAFYFNDRTGLLFVRASGEDLEVIERAVQVLNAPPPQVSLETIFVEIASDGPDLSITSDRFYTDADSKGLRAVFTPSQLDAFLKSLRQRPGTKIVTGRKVTTLTGRQAQISVATPGTEPTTADFPFGPVLGVIPHVLEDSQSIQLNLVAELHRLVRSAGREQMTITTLTTTKPVLPGQTLMVMTADKPGGGDSSAKRPNPMLVFVTPVFVDPADDRVNPPEK